MSDIVRLPENFIGKEDEQRLESFGARLIGHGWATRWHWNREGGFDVAFEIYTGGVNERFLVAIARDRRRDAFVASDHERRTVAEGALDHVMAVIDELARSRRGDPPA